MGDAHDCVMTPADPVKVVDGLLGTRRRLDLSLRFRWIARRWRDKHVLPPRSPCAVRILAAGVDQAVVALWLGHERVDTADLYIHADLAIRRTDPGPPSGSHRGTGLGPSCPQTGKVGIGDPVGGGRGGHQAEHLGMVGLGRAPSGPPVG